MKIKLFSLLILLFIVVSNPSFAADKSFTDMSIAELKDHATSTHPAGLYVLTAKLLKEDKKNEAVFWFYVAQLRFRFYLAANPDLEKSGDPALFSSLQNVIGTPINEYAGGDLDFWADSVKKARDWDKSNPNTLTSKEMHSREYKQVLTGMGKFISYIENNKEKIREQRKANGLTNREQENQHGQIKAALLSSRHFNLPVI